MDTRQIVFNLPEETVQLVLASIEEDEFDNPASPVRQLIEKIYSMLKPEKDLLDDA